MKTKFILTLLAFTFCFVQAQKKAAPKITANKTAIIQSVDKHSKELIEVSDKIWSYEETAFNESQSSKTLSDYAEANGFKVERGVEKCLLPLLQPMEAEVRLLEYLVSSMRFQAYHRKRFLPKIRCMKEDLVMVAVTIYLEQPVLERPLQSKN